MSDRSAREKPDDRTGDRAYALAAYLAALRPDWPLHAIHTALGSLTAYPYDRVAVAAVRAAADPALAVKDPRGIAGLLGKAPSGPGTPTPPPMCRVCRVCRRVHNPDRPDEHVVAAPGSTLRGAAAAREALRAALSERTVADLDDFRAALDGDA